MEGWISKIVIVAVGWALVAGGPAAADDDPVLARTDLYARMTHDCRDVPLAGWRHPTREVLVSNKVPIVGLELCNAGVYPIFHVRLPYEVRTSLNDRFYHRLYMALLKANGFHPFSLRDDTDKVIVEISGTRKEVKEELEMFQ